MEVGHKKIMKINQMIKCIKWLGKSNWITFHLKTKAVI